MDTIRSLFLAAACALLLLAGQGCDDGDAAGAGAGGDDAYEENDTMGTAYDLSAQENVWLSTIAGPAVLVGTGAPIDLDYYRIFLADPANVVVECTFSHAVSDINITLVSTDVFGTRVYSQSTTDNETIDTFAASSGVYYIEIWNCEDGNAQYDLRWHTY